MAMMANQGGVTDMNLITVGTTQSNDGQGNDPLANSDSFGNATGTAGGTDDAALDYGEEDDDAEPIAGEGGLGAAIN